MTPNFALLQIETPGWRGMRLWIPLFLLWIPAILLSPLIFLAIWIYCWVGRINLWRAIAASWAISVSLPGTDIQVHTPETTVVIRLL